MKISARMRSQLNHLESVVETNGTSKTIPIDPKESGLGSSVNGGELLLLSLATCFCNDIWREAAKRNIKVHEIMVTASCEFGAEGEPGHDFHYHTEIAADATAEQIMELVEHTDKVAEIHNTLRKGVAVTIHPTSRNG